MISKPAATEPDQKLPDEAGIDEPGFRRLTARTGTITGFGAKPKIGGERFSTQSVEDGR